MKLDYIDKINEYGDHIVRLYDFDKAEAIKFRNTLQHTIIINQQHLDLTVIDFIEARNCTLTLRISEEDEGIITSNKKQFYCNLTTKGFEQMILLLEPFCNRETKGYQWLYDIDSSTDFLFSPGGTW
jgi:hypothetical protein